MPSFRHDRAAMTGGYSIPGVQHGRLIAAPTDQVDGVS